METNTQDIDWEMALKRIEISQIVVSAILEACPTNVLEGRRREDGSLHIKDIIKLN